MLKSLREQTHLVGRLQHILPVLARHGFYHIVLPFGLGLQMSGGGSFSGLTA